MEGRPTVWEIVKQCADALDEPFTRQQVLDWVRRHHPDADETEVGATLLLATVDTTAGEEPVPGGSGRQPFLERVGHGIYQRLSTTRDAAEPRTVRPVVPPRPLATARDLPCRDG